MNVAVPCSQHFADVRTVRLLADRVEVEVAHELLEAQ
jgi:hypothetical protein